MPIPVTCPSCKLSTNVPDKVAGRVIGCKCGASLRVPGDPISQSSGTIKTTKRRKPEDEAPSAARFILPALLLVAGVALIGVSFTRWFKEFVVLNLGALGQAAYFGMYAGVWMGGVGFLLGGGAKLLAATQTPDEEELKKQKAAGPGGATTTTARFKLGD